MFKLITTTKNIQYTKGLTETQKKQKGLLLQEINFQPIRPHLTQTLPPMKKSQTVRQTECLGVKLISPLSAKSRISARPLRWKFMYQNLLRHLSITFQGGDDEATLAEFYSCGQKECGEGV